MKSSYHEMLDQVNTKKAAELREKHEKSLLQEANPQRRQFDQPQVTPMLVDPCKAQLIAMFDKLDQRGQQAVITCAMFHLRYPKESV